MTAPMQVSATPAIQQGPPSANEPARPPKPMEMDEVLQIIRQEMRSAHGPTLESVISDRGASALEAYLGEPYGDEREGRSQVVMRDVFEVVEWVHPDIVDIFTGSEEIARFRPFGPEDEDEAQQQTDMVNFAVCVENDWEEILIHWSKDGLLRQGHLKYAWEESRAVSYEEYEDVTPVEVALLEQNPDLMVVSQEPSPRTPGTYNITVRRTQMTGRVKLIPVPGEELLIEKEARSFDTARFAAHVPGDMTAGKLREMGYSEEQIARCGGPATPENDAEGQARRTLEGGQDWTSADRMGSERSVYYAECWVRLDLDGDGISELVKVCVGGTGAEADAILHIEPARCIPIAKLTPIVIPHRLQGLGLAETVMDIQRQHTVIMRQGLDGLYLGNYPRWAVLSDGMGSPQANLDQLMNIKPMGYVEETTSGAIRPLQTESTAEKAIPFLELLRQMREERTGVNRFTQGMEAPEINKTATGLVAMQGAANKRVKFYAKCFAIGIKSLFRGVAGLIKQHQRQAKTIRLRGKWIDIDPSTWKHDYDCKLTVGFGHGDKVEQITNIDMVLGYQEKVNGIIPGMVEPKHAYAALAERMRLAGYHAEQFFNDPEVIPPSAPPPSVEEQQLAAWAAIEKRKLDLKELEIQLEHERKVYEMMGKWVEAREPHGDSIGQEASVQ